MNLTKDCFKPGFRFVVELKDSLVAGGHVRTVQRVEVVKATEYNVEWALVEVLSNDNPRHPEGCATGGFALAFLAYKLEDGSISA